MFLCASNRTNFPYLFLTCKTPFDNRDRAGNCGNSGRNSDNDTNSRYIHMLMRLCICVIEMFLPHNMASDLFQCFTSHHSFSDFTLFFAFLWRGYNHWYIVNIIFIFTWIFLFSSSFRFLFDNYKWSIGIDKIDIKCDQSTGFMCISYFDFMSFYLLLICLFRFVSLDFWFCHWIFFSASGVTIKVTTWSSCTEHMCRKWWLHEALKMLEHMKECDCMLPHPPHESSCRQQS